MTKQNFCTKIGSLLVLQLAILGSEQGYSQEFEEGVSNLIEPTLPCVAWGDYDADGDLDLLVSGRVGSPGSISTILYENTAGSYSDSGIIFTALENASADWGDFNDDGKLDLAMCGQDGSGDAVTVIYKNNGSGFDVVTGTFVGVHSGALAWGNYDNDSDLDLIVTGITTDAVPVASTTLYNNVAGVFSAVTEPFPDVAFSSVEWGDYNEDGDLDLVIAGSKSDNSLVAQIFRNDSGSFTDIIAGLPGISYGFATWGDYQNDGDLDLLIGGLSSIAAGKYTRLYVNDNGVMTDAGAGFPALLLSAAAWGDYDNDGDLDFMLTGSTGPAVVSALYRNDAGTFVDSTPTVFPPLYLGAVAWGNDDNDGDLDLLLGGVADSEGSPVDLLRIYRNQLDPASNVLVEQQAGGNIHVVWRGTPGTEYEVESTTDLGAEPIVWTPEDTLEAGIDGLFNVTDLLGTDPARYYRAFRP